MADRRHHFLHDAINGVGLLLIHRKQHEFVTTEASDDMKEQGRQAGATGWIVKPFQADQLREVVQRVLGKNVA